MKPETILTRQEIRQMLTEAGVTRETLKAEIKPTVAEYVDRAVTQAIAEVNIDKLIDEAIAKFIRNEIKESVYHRIVSVFDHMQITIDVKDAVGQSILDMKGGTE